VKTPNIDRLAAEGMMFSNYFCTSPVCSPARASILTGKIPSQHGVHDWIASGSVQKKDYENLEVSRKRYVASLGNHTEEDYKKIPEAGKVPMSMTAQYRFVQHETRANIEYLKSHLGYTDILAESGYTCGLIGKWHLGDSKSPQKSFSHWSVIGKGGCLYHLPDFYRKGELVVEDRYITDLITEEGLEFAQGCVEREEPFYLGLHYTAPHSPWIKEDQPEEIWQSYDACSFESIAFEGVHPWQVEKRHPGYKTAEGRRYKLQGYYTAVTAMDKAIGRVMDRLDELEIRENTLIVFTSDNGMNMGQHGIWGKGNGTFPQNMFDTSVKVPMIISQPGTIVANQQESGLFSHYDVMPTFLDYVGLDYKKWTEDLPGHSFAPLLKGEGYSQVEDVVVYDEYGPVRMIRIGEWKYVHRYPFGPHELYQMENDPDEKLNLIDDETYESVVVKLRGN
jgi:arylsulfatase A-like enzyme